MTRTPGAFKLLVFAGLAACAPSTKTAEDFMTKSPDGSTVHAQRVSGSDVAVCQAVTDEEGDPAQVYGWDGDGDGFAMEPTNPADIYEPVGGYSQYVCVVGGGVPVGYVLVETDEDIGADCDYTDPDVYPGAPETADDGIDQDCNGSDLDSDPDADGDGYPASADCDDADAAVATPATWYFDWDGDAYGDSSISQESCTEPAYYVGNADDCDDGDADINPGATEVCNDGIDDDCNGLADAADDVPEFMLDESFADTDGDGFGDADSTMFTCGVPAGYVDDNSDCDDETWAINPGASEECDEVDNDCDGFVDEGVTTAAYMDGDGDGYGTGTSYEVCELGSGDASMDGDCDDGDDGINPGETDVAGDGIDQDCSGADTPVSDPDSDGDGVVDSLDCNDSDPAVYPGATDVPANGVDEDCSGSDAVDPDDVDNDGFDSIAAGGDDCNDDDSGINPGATDVDNDGLDNDCDGQAVDRVCITGNTSAYPFRLMFSDTTAFPYDDDPNWRSGLASGSTTVCASDITIVAGHSAKWQCGYDMDGDGSYGEDPGDYWCYMNGDVTNATETTIMGMNVFVDNVSWGTGADGILDTIPELPTSIEE